MHVLAPHSYLANSWPLRHICVSSGALDIAAAGTQGFALYDRRARKWRLFGDVGQERLFRVLQLGWLGDVVVASRQDVVARGAQGRHWGEGACEGPCTLVLHSRFFLDEQAVLTRKALPQVRSFWPRFGPVSRPSLLPLPAFTAPWL